MPILQVASIQKEQETDGRIYVQSLDGQSFLIDGKRGIIELGRFEGPAERVFFEKYLGACRRRTPRTRVDLNGT